MAHFWVSMSENSCIFAEQGLIRFLIWHCVYTVENSWRWSWFVSVQLISMCFSPFVDAYIVML